VGEQPKFARVFFGAVGPQEVGAVGGLRPIHFAGVFDEAQADGAAFLGEHLDLEELFGRRIAPEPFADAALDLLRLARRLFAQGGVDLGELGAQARLLAAQHGAFFFLPRTAAAEHVTFAACAVGMGQ
jgi:hypothetical protein